MNENKIVLNEELFLWEKEIDVVHLTGWILEERQQEIDEITQLLLKLERCSKRLSPNPTKGVRMSSVTRKNIERKK